MYLDTQILSAIIAAVVSIIIAVPSALYARRAAKSAENTYSVELIGQLYATYQSEEMLGSLKIAWKIYQELWMANCEQKEEAFNNTSSGLLLPQEVANRYYKRLKHNSSEDKAIHYLTNFWTYVELLLKRKALNADEILAFTSPRILGLLYPMAKAHRARYPEPSDTDKNIILAYAYKVLCHTKK